MEHKGYHITYCTNIHSGETWQEHFEELKKHVPSIKEQFAPNGPMALGLRLSDKAAKELQNVAALNELKSWLKQNDLYVFTFNGFPFGDFHKNKVKDAVHLPDWSDKRRLAYSENLFEILKELLPEGMHGGISTNPLGYRHHFGEMGSEPWKDMLRTSTLNILELVAKLHAIKEEEGKILHLDIEPEPDGILETGDEFFDWYVNVLLPLGRHYFQKHYDYDGQQSERIIKTHVQVCYDICHFALGFEAHKKQMQQLRDYGIRIGKIQVSAALKLTFGEDLEHRQNQKSALENFDEPIYLHQVIARKAGEDGVKRFKDLPDALSVMMESEDEEWRSHFHVPIFADQFGVLQSTQDDILEVLDIQKDLFMSPYLEVETYTWAVLPDSLKLPIDQSIARELNWLKDKI